MQPDKKQLTTIFLVIFIDLLGFGLIIPIVPFYLDKFVGDPNQIGKTFAAMITGYSLMQFIFNPIWGRLSDRIGRRPILLFSLGGTAVTHLFFALSQRLELLFLARILTGMFAATVPTAMAYISDVTSEENRAKGMGLVGAAFGLGFILGPAAGGILSDIGGITLPLYGASLLSLCAFAFAFFTLKESLDFNNKSEGDYRRFNLANLYRALRHPQIGLLFLIFFIVTTSFANLETLFALYVEKLFSFSSKQTGYFFALIGIVSAVTQGVFIGKLAKRYGEKRLVTAGTLLLGIAFILFVLPKTVFTFIPVVIMIAFGLGLHNPSLAALVSKNADRSEQGGILGINQSFSALGRIAGPLWAGYFYDRFGPQVPFVSAGFLILLACLLSLRLYGKNLVQSNS